MSHLEIHAHIKIRPGKLEGFKQQAAEILRLTRELDTKTLRYDWFIDEAGMECEVHEAYVSEEGLFEHVGHVVEARNLLFRDFAYDHQMLMFGEISPRLIELTKKHGAGIRVFSFFQGLERSPTVLPTATAGVGQAVKRVT